MEAVREVEAVAQRGLMGDCYMSGAGSWNDGSPGKRQVTLINARFFEGTEFTYADSRRNIVTVGVELMSCIGREFAVGSVRMRGVKYCDPCQRPSKLSGKPGFAEAFQDCGGLIAEILNSGSISVGDHITPPNRN